MIILSGTSSKVQVLLNAAPAANQLPIVAGVVTIDTTTQGVLGAAQVSTITVTPTGGASVDVVSSPASGTTNQMVQLAIFNADTAQAVVTVRFHDGTNTRNLVKVTLAVGATLYYEGDGWKVINANGQLQAGPNIIDGTVVNSNLANMVASTLKGRNTQSTGAPEDVTMAQLFALLKTQLIYEIPIAVSDETTALTTGVKVTFRMPRAMTLTSIKSSLTTASTSGLPTVDVKKNGITVFSTLLSINIGGKTSVGAVTAAVLSTTALAADDEITIDITIAGNGAKGLKVYLLGNLA